MATELLTPGEVARMFRVSPKQVARWANAGKLSARRDGRGHRRYDPAEIRALLDGTVPPPQSPRERMRDNHARILQVPCPQCDAEALASCRAPGGGRVYFPHQARRHAAAEAGVYVPGGAP